MSSASPFRPPRPRPARHPICRRLPLLPPHLQVDVRAALKLRAELQGLGWSERRITRLLVPFEERIRLMLPPLAEVMADEAAWAALGVRPSRSLTSEVCDLTLLSSAEMPRGRRRGARGASDGAGGSDGTDGDGTDDDDGDAATQARRTGRSASEEIFERHGWNRVESGWSGLGF